MITSEELEARLWAGADRLRGSMDASRYKDYMLGLMFYKFLSEKTLEAFKLPHGVLFRGAAEGIIRERLLEKNYIDAVIGLPANLFTNTGILLIIMVLKKNRTLGEPVLMIDASRGFVKEGKTNHLRERDIARIVDTYLSRQDIAGYSHLATRQEILDNGCNLNIPRYVENLDMEIPHDVDAHLLGGIPQRNLKAMEVLQTVVPDIMAHAFPELRSGYARMEGSMAGLRESILGDGRLAAEAGKLRGEVDAYIGKYWAQFKELGIDRLLWRKWFANITGEISELVREPFERELDLLENILTRYGKTVGELDAEIAEQEKEFEALAAELVVTE